MNVVVVKGDSYLNDETKVNPANLTLDQKVSYMELVTTTRLISRFSNLDRNVISTVVNNIDFKPFAIPGLLNEDQKLLLSDLIKMQLFLCNIKTDTPTMLEIVSRF